MERPGCSIPDAAETARVREALLHPRSRRSSDRSGANHGPRGGLVARPLACEYARPGIRVNRAGGVVRVQVTRRWVMTQAQPADTLAGCMSQQIEQGSNDPKCQHRRSGEGEE